MKKNNKFRNNGGGSSNAYSLNYRFDSISPAGKYSGTALDLIKRYNELAKEAHGNGDYVAMEVFRQYAEHYRKIVTEINERKAIRGESENEQNAQAENTQAPENTTESQTEEVSAPEEKPLETNNSRLRVEKSFHVVEIRAEEADTAKTEVPVSEKPRRTLRRRKVLTETPVENQAEVAS